MKIYSDNIITKEQAEALSNTDRQQFDQIKQLKTTIAILGGISVINFVFMVVIYFAK